MYSSASWLGGSTLLNAAVGFAFWIIAARLVPADVLGVEGTALNLIMLLAWLSQLGMHNALPRFVPVAGTGARRLVLRSYTAAIGVALALGLGWLVWDASSGERLLGLPLWLTVLSAASVVAWTVFSLQDSVLVSVRQPRLVAAQNAAYSVAKLALLVPLAALMTDGALLLAWMAPVLLFIPPVTVYLFRRALPRHSARQRRTPGVVAFVAHDLPGGAASMLAVRLVPVVVLAQVGGRETALFLIAWQVLTVLELALSSLGLAFAVEAAGSGVEQTRRLARSLLLQMVPLAAVGSLLLALLAGPVMSLFGREYAAEATDVLRILAATLALRVIVECALSVMRVRSDLRALLALETARAPLALGLCWVLAGSFGVEGAAAAYAVTNVVLAVLAVAYLVRVLRPTASPVAGAPGG
jgi:O-antigen/teichoic acid export membrane protein